MRIFATAILLSFPAALNLVPHAGSVILLLLIFAGLCSFRRQDPLEPWEKWIMGAFAVYVLVATLCFAINALGGTHPDPQAKYLDRPLRFLGFIPIYMFFRKTRPPEWAIWSGLSLGAIASGLFALAVAGTSPDGSIVSNRNNHIVFGDLSLLFGFLALLGIPLFRRCHPFLAAVPVAAFLLGINGSLLSGARGGWIAIPFLSLLVAWKLCENRKLPLKLACGILLVAIPSFMTLLPGSPASARMQKAWPELTGHGKEESGVEATATGSRLVMWKSAWTIYGRNPFIGAGRGSFSGEQERLIEEGVISAAVERHNHPHNIFLTALSEGGAVGLAALLALLILPTRQFIRTRSSAASWAGVVLIAGYIHFGLTESLFLGSLFVSFFLVMTAAFLATGPGSSTDARGCDRISPE